MKKVYFTKKIVLIILTVILLLLLLSNYIKTTDKNTTNIFKDREKSLDEKLFSEKDDHKASKNKAHDLLDKNSNKKEKQKIENIALIEELKDPFELNEKTTAKTTANENQLLSNQQLYSNSENNAKIEKNKVLNLDKSESEENNKSSAEPKFLNNIQFPFELLGIIKNKNNSSALFLYQGKNVLKEETDEIDIFKIEKINKKEIILSFKDQKTRLHLWEAE